MGATLAAAITRSITDMATANGGDDPEGYESDLLDRMADAAGIERETIAQILANDINCPPMERLVGFASVLDGVSTDDLVDAAQEDGCTYDQEEEEESADGDDKSENHEDADKKVVIETLSRVQPVVEAGKKLRKVKAIGITADVLNANGRVYPAEVLREAVRDTKLAMEADGFYGRQYLLGESEHPSSRMANPDLTQNVVNWTSIDYDETIGAIVVEGIIVETAKGKDILANIEAGIYPRVSQRAWASSKEVELPNGQVAEQMTRIHIIEGYDLVVNPSDPQGGIHTVEGKDTMSAITIDSVPSDVADEIVRRREADRLAAEEKARKEKEQEDAEISAAIAEKTEGIRSQLGLSETDDLFASVDNVLAEAALLREESEKRKVAEFVESEIGKLKYDEESRATLLQMVTDRAPKSVEEAKAEIVQARNVTDKMVARLSLARQGFGIQSISSNFEETGVPEFAEGAFHITESRKKRGVQTIDWNKNKPKGKAQTFAAKILESFDAHFQHQLAQETAQFTEALDQTQLNLPYTVSRSIIMEAYPELIASQIFDTDVAEGGPTTVIYYEKTKDSHGMTATSATIQITDVRPGEWIQLPDCGQIPGSSALRVTSASNGGPTGDMVEYDDYLINPADGKLMIKPDNALGLIADADPAVSHFPIEVELVYNYIGLQCVGCEEIPCIENELCSEVIEICGHKLATEICQDAVVFARSSLSYDVVQRTLDNLIRRVREHLDRTMFHLALIKAMSYPDNIVGVWHSTPWMDNGGNQRPAGTPEQLARLIGLASVRVRERNYNPSWLLTTHMTNDILSNWTDGYAHRPDSMLEASGMVGRVKGLDVYATNNWIGNDEFIMVGDMQHLFYRVLTPMAISGPHPSYDTTVVDGPNGPVAQTKIKDADFYMGKEYSGMHVPECGKAALIRIAK